MTARAYGTRERARRTPRALSVVAGGWSAAVRRPTLRSGHSERAKRPARQRQLNLYEQNRDGLMRLVEGLREDGPLALPRQQIP